MIADAQEQPNAGVAAVTEYLRRYASSPSVLWEAMPGAFLAAFGRELDKTDAHDLMLCHAALAPFNLEDQ